MRAAEKGAYHGLAYQQRKYDGLTFSEIVINNQDRILAIVVDVDRPDASNAWMDADIAAPNFIVISWRGHAHYVWVLDDERGGTIWPQTQPGAVRYADAIQRELTRAVCGDLRYAWMANPTHNPRHEAYKTIVIRDQPYRLDEIAMGLDLIDSAPRRTWNGFESASELDFPLVQGARNDGVFRRLMRQATKLMRRNRDDEAYYADLIESAEDLNDQCDVPMDYGEVLEIVDSVLRYRPFQVRDRAAERKARRAEEGRTWTARLDAKRERQEQAIKMRKSGMLIADIATKLGVTTRTVERYVSGVSVLESDPILLAPIQGYISSRVGFEDLEAPISGANVLEISEKIWVRSILGEMGQIVSRTEYAAEYERREMHGSQRKIDAENASENFAWPINLGCIARHFEPVLPSVLRRETKVP